MQCCYINYQTTWRAPGICLKNLLDHEKNYSVIDKEALAITLVLQGMCMATNSPHVQITSIGTHLRANQEIPKMAANRLQRWAVINT